MSFMEMSAESACDATYLCNNIIQDPTSKDYTNLDKSEPLAYNKLCCCVDGRGMLGRKACQGADCAS